MAKPTLRDCIVASLLAEGWRQAETRSGKYLCFKRSTSTVFVGRAGALRRGPVASKSWAVPVPVRLRHIEAGRRILAGRDTPEVPASGFKLTDIC